MRKRMTGVREGESAMWIAPFGHVMRPWLRKGRARAPRRTPTRETVAGEPAAGRRLLDHHETAADAARRTINACSLQLRGYQLLIQVKRSVPSRVDNPFRIPGG